MPMSSKKGYIEVKNYAHDKQEVVTWKSRIMPMSSKKLLHGGLATMPMTSKKLLHGGLELCP